MGNLFGWGLRGVGFGRGTLPRRSWWLGGEGAGKVSDNGLVRAGRGQRELDAGAPLDDTGSDLDEARTQGVELGKTPTGALWRSGPQAMHQPIGGRVEDEAELVGLGVVAGGAIRGEMGLVGLDQILHLPAHAIDVLVESLGLAPKIGDDEAAVAALVGGFDASDDAALLAPAPSGIDEFAITPNLGVAGVMRRPTHGRVSERLCK